MLSTILFAHGERLAHASHVRNVSVFGVLDVQKNVAFAFLQFGPIGKLKMASISQRNALVCLIKNDALADVLEFFLEKRVQAQY